LWGRRGGAVEQAGRGGEDGLREGKEGIGRRDGGYAVKGLEVGREELVSSFWLEDQFGQTLNGMRRVLCEGGRKAMAYRRVKVHRLLRDGWHVRSRKGRDGRTRWGCGRCILLVACLRLLAGGGGLRARRRV